jgi:diacylglycerol kinase family enzyme
MNPRSGNHAVDRFGLIAKAEQAGAQVLVTTAERGAAALARLAVERGAGRLGVAGGDGTVSAVAAVAADTQRPLIVLPAGTLNHFARDLGLDTSDPLRALPALVDPDEVRVDLGVVQARTFVNNVSFGPYAEALLEPGYREAKARSFASVAPAYVEGDRAVDASIATPGGAIDRPQVVLVSNNPYHIATVRSFGQRFSLQTGLLGAIVVKRRDQPPGPGLVADMRGELRRTGGSAVPGSGVVVWSAPEIVLRGGDSMLPAGVDGEPVEFHLPITCQARPGALTVHLPKDRPALPARGTGQAPSWPRPGGPVEVMTAQRSDA